jgi:ribose 5-phosphate isomerase B
MRKIAIGGDHAGYQYKSLVMQHLENQGLPVEDFGPYSEDSVDYPDFAHPVASFVETNADTLGILICGSGNGVAMAANKHADIRAALCWNEDLAQLAREHNDANIICIPARFVSTDLALKMVDLFLKTGFEGGRHANRVKKIAC